MAFSGKKALLSELARPGEGEKGEAPLLSKRHPGGQLTDEQYERAVIPKGIGPWKGAMRSRAVDHPRLLSLTAGRTRVHLPGWAAREQDQLEARLRQVRGVEAVQANPLTGNVLIRFDPRVTGEQGILAEINQFRDGLLAVRQPPQAPRLMYATGDTSRQPMKGRGLTTSPLMRVGVRGLLGQAVVDSLWFAAGFLGEAFGLPLAGLGPLHVLTDVAVWGMALGSARGEPHGGRDRDSPR